MIDKSVSHWDLDPSDYWQTVAVKKLELLIGPFRISRGIDRTFSCLVPVPEGLFKECGWEGPGVEYLKFFKIL